MTNRINSVIGEEVLERGDAHKGGGSKRDTNTDERSCLLPRCGVHKRGKRTHTHTQCSRARRRARRSELLDGGESIEATAEPERSAAHPAHVQPQPCTHGVVPSLTKAMIQQHSSAEAMPLEECSQDVVLPAWLRLGHVCVQF
jgi:hypothetical protein